MGGRFLKEDRELAQNVVRSAVARTRFVRRDGGAEAERGQGRAPRGHRPAHRPRRGFHACQRLRESGAAACHSRKRGAALEKRDCQARKPSAAPGRAALRTRKCQGELGPSDLRGRHRSRRLGPAAFRP